MIILLLAALSFFFDKETGIHFIFISLGKIVLSILIGLTFLLFWIGASPVVYPYDFLGKILVLLYFTIFTFNFILF
jgi:hypothetical protein